MRWPEPMIGAAKERLRKPYRELRRKLLRHFRGFEGAELIALLRKCGVETGDAICVHSGMSGFVGFAGSAPEIVRGFQNVVGEQGCLIMPALSFSGSALEYARGGAVFDPQRTPARTGLICELFRRFPGVARSFHPTHSLCIWSRDAEDWIATHLEADTPCGRHSPFEHFAGRDVKIVFAGASPATLTYFHFVEEVLEPQMPFSPFTAERYSLPCRRNGVVIQSPPMRLYEPEVSRRRTLDPLFEELRRAGEWREGKVGTLEVVVLRARAIVGVAERLASRGVYCYRQS